jgi:hypothetical protein
MSQNPPREMSPDGDREDLELRAEMGRTALCRIGKGERLRRMTETEENFPVISVNLENPLNFLRLSKIWEGY